MESFAESGAWHTRSVTVDLTRSIEKAPGRIWHGFHVSAVDDTKVHRSGLNVWGTCTFHESTARCPNRATTVRVHNWVVLGALLHEPERPAWFLPISGRLYFRKSQLPDRPGSNGGKEVFRTKCELAVVSLRAGRLGIQKSGETTVQLESASLQVFFGNFMYLECNAIIVTPIEGLKTSVYGGGLHPQQGENLMTEYGHVIPALSPKSFDSYQNNTFIYPQLTVHSFEFVVS